VFGLHVVIVSGHRKSPLAHKWADSGMYESELRVCRAQKLGESRMRDVGSAFWAQKTGLETEKWV